MPHTQVQDNHAYVYVFVREDLSHPQQIVQSCHAAIEAATHFSLGSLAEHPSVIVLSAKSEQKLHNVRKYLVDNGIKHAHFYEPDIGDELTALATEPLVGERRDLFKKYQLLDGHVIDTERWYEARWDVAYYSECSHTRYTTGLSKRFSNSSAAHQFLRGKGLRKGEYDKEEHREFDSYDGVYRVTEDYLGTVEEPPLPPQPPKQKTLFDVKGGV